MKNLLSVLSVLVVASYSITSNAEVRSKACGKIQKVSASPGSSTYFDRARYSGSGMADLLIRDGWQTRTIEIIDLSAAEVSLVSVAQAMNKTVCVTWNRDIKENMIWGNSRFNIQLQ